MWDWNVGGKASISSFSIILIAPMWDWNKFPLTISGAPLRDSNCTNVGLKSNKKGMFSIALNHSNCTNVGLKFFQDGDSFFCGGYSNCTNVGLKFLQMDCGVDTYFPILIAISADFVWPNKQQVDTYFPILIAPMWDWNKFKSVKLTPAVQASIVGRVVLIIKQP